MTSNTKTPYLKMKQSTHKRPPMNRERRPPEPEEVGGLVQGKKAYATEVMWAKGLERASRSYIFQFEVPTAYTLPGKQKQVDFLVDGIYADEIDGEIGHKTESQKAKDAERDILLAPYLQALGINSNVRRVDAQLFTDNKRIDQLIREYYL